MHKIFDLKEMDIEQLHALASDLGIKGFKRMEKDTLVYAILDEEARKNALNAPERPERARKGRPKKSEKPAAEQSKPKEQVKETEKKEEPKTEKSEAKKEAAETVAEPKSQTKKRGRKPKSTQTAETAEVPAAEPVEVTAVEAEEKPKEETTGNAELDKMIADGKLAISEMKRLNDSIQDETISRQIDRLEEISGKIFAQVEAEPKKLPQIRKFMSYYLPTTLKLLNAYDRMSGQGVAGENIGGTMQRVEQMMDTIVQAFEKQLDSLFGAEALDISTDITVLDNMMAREGLVDDMIHRKVNQPSAAPADDDEELSGGITLEL